MFENEIIFSFARKQEKYPLHVIFVQIGFIQLSCSCLPDVNVLSVASKHKFRPSGSMHWLPK